MAGRRGESPLGLSMSFEGAERSSSMTRKSRSEKAAVCSYKRQSVGCRVLCLSERLNMGVAAGVSRCLKRLRTGELEEGMLILKSPKSSLKT